jgi:hypothetical protein
VANTRIQLKFSTVASNTPTGLANGEIAINSADGKLYYRTPGGSITYLNATYPAGLTTEVQFNDAGVMGSNSGFTFAKSSQLLTVTGSANIGGMNVVPTITSAYAFANTVNIKTDAAFTKANNALANTSGTVFNGDLKIGSGGKLTVLPAGGDEGGEILLDKPPNGTLGGGVTIDAYQDKLRIFEQGGAARGVYIDLTQAAGGVATNLLNPTATPDAVARITANAAFDKANSANILAQAAFNQANSEPIGSGAFTKANSANILAQAAFDSANISSGTYATSAFAKANAANVLAQAAYDTANLKFNTAGGTITGNVTISNGRDLTVTGNLYVQGNTVSLNTATLDVVDSLITLGAGNYTTDLLDIGFAGHYNAGTNAHTGLIRDYGSKEWYFFKGYTPELSGNNNINLNDASFATDNVNANYFKGNLIGTTIVLTGNVSANYFSGNGSLLTGVARASSADSVANGTSNVNIVTANGNVTIAVGGVSPIVTVSNTGITTNTITANVITVGTGIGGNVLGINFIYANNFIANTGGYFQFADGSKQYTANAASLIGQGAFDKANSANILAQAAFNQANSEPIGSEAFTKANSANILAQAAYDFANTANIKVDSSYAFANTVNIKVDSAYAFANTVNIKTDAAFTKANAANVLAQAAFNAANTAGSVLSQAAFDKANSANILAQASFDFANTVNVKVDSAYAFANTINIKVDSVYSFANIANIKVDSAYTFANTVNIKTDSAYAWANTINIKVDSAYTQANAANILAQAAFNAANSAGGGASQAAYDKANSANVLAQAAFDKANTGGGSGSSGNTSIGENIFTANGSQTAFTLSTSVTQDSVLVFVSGVLQPNSYYTVVGSNTTITLADAPAANDTVVVKKFTGGGGSSSGGASVSISDAPPTSPTANSLWWQSNTGILKIYYTDTDSSQWVDASPSSSGSSSTDTLSPFLLMGA